MAKNVLWNLENREANEKDAIEVTHILSKLDEFGKEYIKKVVAAKIPKGLILIALIRMIISFIKSQFESRFFKETLNLTIVSLQKEFENEEKEKE